MVKTSNALSEKDLESLINLIIDNIFPLSKQREKGNTFLGETHSEEEVRSYLDKHTKELIREIHTGFNRAQHLIVDTIIILQKEKKSLKNDLKIARKAKLDEKK